MSARTDDTLVTPVTEPASPAERALDFARFALGAAAKPSRPGVTLSRHLAFLPADSLALDLEDPAQRHFGDYELVEQLGQGGMGVVYRARQQSLDREVALKLLAAGPWASTDFIERFRREAQSAARMAHPNIVPIYEIGQFEELNFFTMRLVRGPSLANVLDRQGPYAPAEAARLMRTIAEALDYAHRLGVLHLDLKPGNVLIDEHGEPQVADFGLARRLDDTLSADTDEVSGTPSYMAPEQAQLKRHRLSPATDIYGLGAILFELLTGRPPFLAGNAQETLRRVVMIEPERPSALRDGIPADLDAICLKCLAKEPRERYRSARELGDDLGRYCEGRPVSVRPLSATQRALRWAKREPRVAASALAVVVALAVGLTATALEWRRAEANADAARTNLWKSRSQVAQAALGAGDAFRGLRGLMTNLAEMDAAGRTEDARLVRERIGAVLANAPQLVDSMSIGSAELITGLALAPDRRSIAVATVGNGVPRRMRLIDLETHETRWITPTDGLTHGLAMADGLPHSFVRFSPDGEHVIATLLQMAVLAAPTITDSLAFDVHTGAVIAPPDALGPYSDLLFSDDASLAMMRVRSDQSLRFPDIVQLFDTHDWRALGPRQHLPGGATEWMFAPDNKRIVGSHDFTTFTFRDPATLATHATYTLPEQDLARSWRFSPDGRFFALGTLSGAVHLVDPSNGRATLLTASPTTGVSWLEFAADGATLAAIADNGQIAVWDVASGRPRTGPLLGAMEHKSEVVRLVDDELFAVGNNVLESWQLTPLAPFGNQALPAAARLRSPRHFWPHGFAVDPSIRLLVTGDVSGTIRTWQLPPRVMLPYRAAPLVARDLTFDGRTIADVDGARVTLRDVADGTALTPALVHAVPVRFAELTHDARRLVTIAGRTVRVFDADGRLIAEPVVLPQSPIRAAIATAAPVFVATTGTFDDGRFRETLHLIDLDSGVQRASIQPDVAGLWDGLTIDPQGRYAFAQLFDDRTYAPAGNVFVDLTGKGRSCTTIPPEGGEFVGDLVLAADGRTAWFHLWAHRTHRIVRFDTETCQRLRVIETKLGGYGTTLAARGTGVVAQRLAPELTIAYDADGTRHDAPSLPQAQVVADFAVSADGERIAQATRSSVQVIDLVRGERVTAVMGAPLAGNDGIAKLAFAPDGAALLGRTFRGRWLYWRLPAATQDLATLTALGDVLDPQDASIGAALRPVPVARDVAPSRAAEPPRPDVVLAPAAADGPAPQLLPLDLGAALNVPLQGDWSRRAPVGGDAATLTTGLHRFDGIDWRLDGGVQLSRGGPATVIHPTLHESARVAVPSGRYTRVHALVLQHIPLRAAAPPRPAVHIVLHAGDGRAWRLDVMTKRDVATHGDGTTALPGARVAWRGAFGSHVRDGGSASVTPSNIYAVRLDVPPDAVASIASLHFEAPDGPMEAPLVYAITLERADESTTP